MTTQMKFIPTTFGVDFNSPPPIQTTVFAHSVTNSSDGSVVHDFRHHCSRKRPSIEKTATVPHCTTMSSTLEFNTVTPLVKFDKFDRYLLQHRANSVSLWSNVSKFMKCILKNNVHQQNRYKSHFHGLPDRNSIRHWRPTAPNPIRQTRRK